MPDGTTFHFVESPEGLHYLDTNVAKHNKGATEKPCEHEHGSKEQIKLHAQ